MATNSLPTRRLFDDDDQPLRFGFEVEWLGGELTLLIGGRWHREHNRDYLPGLDLILARLATVRASLLDAWVDTAFTRRHGLTREQCRLPIRGRHYPVLLSGIEDFTQFRKDLLAAIGSVGLPPGSRGSHTPLKQLRLSIALPKDALPDLVAAFIARRRH